MKSQLSEDSGTSDHSLQSQKSDDSFMNPSGETLDPWTRVAVALCVSALCIIGYLQLSHMDSRFFQFSLSGAKGLFFYMIGDDLAASNAYRDHFRIVGHSSGSGILSGKLDRLRKDAEGAQKLDSNDSNALLILGAVALEKGNPKQASLFFDHVLQMYPDHARGLLFSAIAQARIGHFEKALYQINRGLRNGKIAWDYYSFLLLLETAGSFNDKPASEKPWSFIAQLYRYLRIFDPSNGTRAIDYAQEAVDNNNFPAHSHLTMSVVYTKQGKLIQALEAALQATEVDKTFPDGYWRAGYIYGQLGDIANQYVMYKTAFELAPGEPLFVRNLGFVMMEKLGDAQQTIQLFERAVQANPRNWYAYQRLGEAYVFLGDHHNAINRYHIALKINLDDGASDKGERDYKERVVDIYEALASSQRELDQINDAIETLHQAIKFSPKNVWPRVSLVYLYKDAQRYEDAVHEISIALQARWLGTSVHSGLCSVLYEANESKQAADCFRRVLKRDPYDRRARRLLPEVLQSVNLENANQKVLEQL